METLLKIKKVEIKKNKKQCPLEEGDSAFSTHSILLDSDAE